MTNDGEPRDFYNVKAGFNEAHPFVLIPYHPIILVHLAFRRMECHLVACYSGLPACQVYIVCNVLYISPRTQ
jgi:hypothetical protein